MITFCPLVFAHHRRVDGTYPVKIRVTFRGKRKYLPTTLVCQPSDLTRSLKIKNADIIARCNQLCDRLRSEAATLNPYDLEGRDVDWVVRTQIGRAHV